MNQMQKTNLNALGERLAHHARTDDAFREQLLVWIRKLRQDIGSRTEPWQPRKITKVGG